MHSIDLQNWYMKKSWHRSALWIEPLTLMKNLIYKLIYLLLGVWGNLSPVTSGLWAFLGLGLLSYKTPSWHGASQARKLTLAGCMVKRFVTENSPPPSHLSCLAEKHLQQRPAPWQGHGGCCDSFQEWTLSYKTSRWHDDVVKQPSKGGVPFLEFRFVDFFFKKIGQYVKVWSCMKS